MPIDRLDFENLVETDLIELVTGQVPEGLRIDYKRDLYGNSDSHKRELLKDVSAFANAFGGHLIIGIEEQDGMPISISGISDINPDEEVLRIEQIIRSGLEPNIQGIRTLAVSLDNGAHCIVSRVPRSWHPPHRVSAQNSNRFYIRNSGAVHEASIEELRTLFTLGADALDRVHKFRDERLQEIISGSSARPLQGGGRLILHIVPLAGVTSNWHVEPAKASALFQEFLPIGTNHPNPGFNFEGFVNERAGERNLGYTQVFRNGAIEATKADIIIRTDVKHQPLAFIPGNEIEIKLFRVLSHYLNGLRDLGVPPPLIVLLTLEGVKGASYIPIRNDANYHRSEIERDTLYLPECVINEYGLDSDYQRAVRPAFDALWNLAGYSRAQSFTEDGVWTGNA